MRERATRTDYSKPVDTMPPKVCAVVVYHRDPTNAMLLECLESLSVQSYANIECVTVDNRDNGQTIGAARNQAIALTDADLVLFLAEEDMLTPDTVQAMVDLYRMGKENVSDLIHITTNCMVQLEGGQRVLSQMKAPGMFERSFLLDNPFDDHDRPDATMAQKLVNLASIKQQPVHFGTTHHFGYVMRMHPFRRDGINVKVNS